MPEKLPRRSHPLVGWTFVALGAVGLLLNLGFYLWHCRSVGFAPWPVGEEALAALAGIVRASVPAAILLVLGVLLPLQRLAGQPGRMDLLSRTVTATLLVVFGGIWLVRLNTVGFASLWARREVLGELVLPAALLENRVWSANIMLVLAVAVLSLPLNQALRKLLSRRDLPRAAWPLWLLGGVWWVGLAAVLLIAGAR